MKLRPAAAFAVVLLALPAIAAQLPAEPPPPVAVAPAEKPTGPIDNAKLQQLMAACNAQASEATKAGKDYTASMTAAANELMGKLDIEALTTEQMEMLLNTIILRNISPPHTAPVMRRLGVLSADQTALGARAAIVRLTLIGYESDAAEQRIIIDTCLKHPGYKAALQSGMAREGINCTQAVPYAMVKHITPLIADMANTLPDELDPIMSWQTSYLMDMVLGARLDPPLPPEKINALRAKCLTIQKNALAKLEKQAAGQPALAASQQDTRNRLIGNITYLEGAFARGDLLGNPAPEIEFVWCSSEPKLKKLSDLRGKVVVLDFWATWCGPCRRSIPNVAKLLEHYKDKPVVVIGITHPQGFHIDSNNQRVETRGQPEREFSLMADFLAPMKITWPQVFTSDGRTNAEYGVRTIPHMVIIDAAGKVRHRGLNPLVPIEEKILLIDPLLAEMDAKK